MRRAILWALCLSVVAPASAAELATVVSPAGVRIDLPADWTAIPLPTGALCQSAERNALGLPAVTVTVARDDKAWGDLLEEARDRAERKSQPKDQFTVEVLEHAAGRAFRQTRRTVAGNGLVQVVYATLVETAQGVWRINWAVSPREDPDRFEALAVEVAASFRSD